jgi:RND family efflux transporter MFP subunit
MKILGRRINLSIIVAAVGLVGAVLFTFTKGNPPPPPSNNLVSPPVTPYMQSVSGTGLVEANSRNVAVGVFVSGVIAAVKVNEGDKVKAGDVLLVTDTRSAESDLAVAQANVRVAQAQLDDEEDLLKRYNNLQGGVSISVTQKQRQIFIVRKAKANLESAVSTLASAKIMLNKHTVTAPISGEILKVRVRAGEFASSGTTNAPIVIGNTSPLHLRVQIDENDLWRFNEKAKAIAYLRSNKERKYNLTFVRVEPLVQPKTQLSGNATELVDTRIMEVVYSIDPLADAPLYVGQQLDVFIDATGKQ